MTKEVIEHAAKRFADEIKKEYGSRLIKVVLFGSCARGDFEDDSDIDIMVLIDATAESIPDEREKVLSIIYRLDDEFNYDVLFSPIIQSETVYEKYLPILPFYQSIEREGVRYA